MLARGLLELVVAGDEVGLGVDLDQRRRSLPSTRDRPTRPSAATRSAFLAALDRPLVRSQSIDGFDVAVVLAASAFLQSIMPAPVFSRRSLTSAAVISAMVSSFSCGRRIGVPAARTSVRQVQAWPIGRGCDGRLAPVVRAGGSAGRRQLARPAPARGRLGGAEVDARRRLAGGQAVEHRVGDQVAVELDGARGVVVARDRDR